MTDTELYCSGQDCIDMECGPDSECCEAICGCCPRVSAQDGCWLGPRRDDGSRYCNDHGES